MTLVVFLIDPSPLTSCLIPFVSSSLPSVAMIDLSCFAQEKHKFKAPKSLITKSVSSTLVRVCFNRGDCVCALVSHCSRNAAGGFHRHLHFRNNNNNVTQANIYYPCNYTNYSTEQTIEREKVVVYLEQEPEGEREIGSSPC